MAGFAVRQTKAVCMLLEEISADNSREISDFFTVYQIGGKPSVPFGVSTYSVDCRAAAASNSRCVCTIERAHCTRRMPKSHCAYRSGHSIGPPYDCVMSFPPPGA